MTTDQAIQRKFDFRGRMRNLPFYSRGPSTRDDLAVLFHELGFTTGVEVGTWKGNFAEVLCNANPALRLSCVDPWMPYQNKSQAWEDRFYRMAVRRLRGRNVEIIRKTSAAACPDFKDGSLDFAFIDGNHLFDFAMVDLIGWVPKVRVGGIVAVHDFDLSEHGADVVTAVYAYTQAHHVDPWYVTREQNPTAYWVVK